MDFLEKIAERAEHRKMYMRTYMNTYYDSHKDVILKQQQDQKKRYRENNLEKVKLRQREWYLRKKAEKVAK
jgi:hypothetical protein